MDREEVEKILSEGVVNPKYQMALTIAKQNGWDKEKEKNIPTANLPETKKKKSWKEKLVMSSDEMQKMTGERDDVKNAVRRSQIANPSVGVIDRVTGNVTGLNEDVLDPFALKAKDLNSDGTIAAKDLRVGSGTSGNFIGAEENKGSDSGSKTSTGIDSKAQSFMNSQNAIANAQEDKEYDRQDKERDKRWAARMKNIDKMTASMKNIDDHFIDQLPTFMFKRFSNGEFGDPKSSDAKLRLAYFMLNGVQSKLKQASNLAMANAGKSPQFADTTSDYEKYQATNLEEGMSNRWNKYKQETQSAIDLAKQGGMSEEALTDSIATISSNNRLQSTFNQMNERQKVFALQVLGEIGDKLGNMNDTEFANTLFGMSAMGDSLDYKEAAGMLIYRFVKDPEKRNSLLSELGFTSGNSKKNIINLGSGLLNSD